MDVVIVSGLVLFFSMVGKKAEDINISAPMVFLTVGAMSALVLNESLGEKSPEIIRVLAELTLIVVLFHDASTVHWKELYVGLPLRLLCIGLPITLTSIYYCVKGLMPELGIYSTLLIAAALTPTDAGLGAPTILNPKVPVVIRHALNVESGVNDGLVTPIVLIAIAGLQDNTGNSNSVTTLPQVALAPISLAIALAVVVSPLCSKLIDYSQDSMHNGKRTSRSACSSEADGVVVGKGRA